jgi:4-hydroxybenzoate polyprenyltransferase
METSGKRRFSKIAEGFFLLSHPGPVLLHIIAVTLFTLLAARPTFFWRTILLVIAAHAAMQLSIAFLNDYCDRHLDARSKRGKPIVRGLVRPNEALLAGLLMIVVMLILLIQLNFLALLISLVYLVLFQGYNLGLKSTPLSGIIFAVGMPLIPLYAFAGIGYIPSFFLWLVPVGFLLGVVINVSNSLPDIEEDAANGAMTLAVVLGVKHSFFVCDLLLAITALVIALVTATRLLPAQPGVVLATLLVTCLLLICMIVFFGPTKPASTRKAYFYLAALTCIMLAGGWLIGVFI